jgi:hypothetical protein
MGSVGKMSKNSGKNVLKVDLMFNDFR